MTRPHNVLAGVLLLLLASILYVRLAESAQTPPMRLFTGDNTRIRYSGRIDYSNPKVPRLWASGSTIQTRFKGTSCSAILNDEVRWGKNHNYIDIVVDDAPSRRLQLKDKTNTVMIADNLPPGQHTVTIYKDTEAAIGYVEFVGFQCSELTKLPARPKRKLEFIGDSITCGAESDLSEFPCGKGEWFDRHNASHSYGVLTAQKLNAEWHITSRSGIGLMHSCCDMKETMPDIWDRVNIETGGKVWDFSLYQPDVLVICLGQNDGEQEPTAFRDQYSAFLKKIRVSYPKTRIVCISSPMGSDSLRKYQRENLAKIVDRRHQQGDLKVDMFLFAKSYNRGCGGHPDLADHQLIANELSGHLKSTSKW